MPTLAKMSIYQYFVVCIPTFLLLIKCHLSKAQFIKMQPGTDDSFLVVRKVNDSITFKCSLKTKTGDVSLLSFIYYCRKNDECEMKESKLKGDSLTLEIKHLQVEDSGSYFCSYNGTLQYPRRNLIVGYLPVAPWNLSCVAYDLYNMSCTWKIQEINRVHGLPISWFVSYYRPDLDSGFRKVNCSVQKKSEVLTCLWSQDEFMPYFRHKISVKAQNAIGETEKFFIVDPIDKAKPSSVTYISATSTSHSVVLKWKISDHLYMFLGDMSLQYSVSYWTRSNKDYRNEIFESGKSSLSITLKSLRPFSWYSVEVRSRLYNQTGYWSDGMRVKIRTKETVPSEAPTAIDGGYCIRNKTLLIYTKEMPKGSKNADEVEYVIHLSTSTNVSVISTHLSMPTIKVDLPHSDLHHSGFIQLYAQNRFGLSSKAKVLHFTTEKISDVAVWTEYNISSGMTEITYKNQGQRVSEPSKIIFFWCKRSGNTGIPMCKEDVNWIERIGSNSVALAVPREYNWLYGVTLINKDGISDGLHFSRCNFRPIPNEINPTIQSDVAKHQSKVTLIFDFDVCHDLPARPLWFLVFFGDGDQMTNKTCGEEPALHVLNVTWNPKMNSIPVNDLNLQRTYGFCIQIVLQYKPNLNTNTIFIMPGKEYGIHTDISFVMVVIAISISGILIMTIIFLRSWKFRKSWQKKYPVVMPDVSRKFSQKECLIVVNLSNQTLASSGKSERYDSLKDWNVIMPRYSRLQKMEFDTNDEEPEEMEQEGVDSDNNLDCVIQYDSSDSDITNMHISTEDNRIPMITEQEHLLSKNPEYVQYSDLHKWRNKDVNTASSSDLCIKNEKTSDLCIQNEKTISSDKQQYSMLDAILEDLISSSNFENIGLSKDEVSSYVRGTMYVPIDLDEQNSIKKKQQDLVSSDYVHMTDGNLLPRTNETGSIFSCKISEHLNHVKQASAADLSLKEGIGYISHSNILTSIKQGVSESKMESILS